MCHAMKLLHAVGSLVDFHVPGLIVIELLVLDESYLGALAELRLGFLALEFHYVVAMEYAVSGCGSHLLYNRKQIEIERC